MCVMSLQVLLWGASADKYTQENDHLRASLRMATGPSYQSNNTMSTSASDSTPAPFSPPKKRAFSSDVIEIDSDGDLPMVAPRGSPGTSVSQSSTLPREVSHNGQTSKRHRSNAYRSVDSDGEVVLVMVCNYPA